MTQRKNVEIHTCTKCGELVWRFERLEEVDTTGDGLPWLVGGVLAGLVVARLLDRS